MAENVNTQQLVDALGRIAEVSPKAGDALSELAQAMSAAVSDVKGGKSEFFNLIEDKDNKIKKFADFLRDDMPKAFKELASEIDAVRKKLKDAVDVMGKKGKSSKGGAVASGGGCPCEDVLNAIKTNLTTIAGAATGSGIKLENQAMDILKSIDKRLRKMSVNSGRMPTGERLSGRHINASPGPSAPTAKGGGSPALGLFEADQDAMHQALGLLGVLDDQNDDFSKKVDVLVESWMGAVRQLYWAKGYFDGTVGNLLDRMHKESEEKTLSFEKLGLKMETYLTNIHNAEREISITKKRQLRQEMLRMHALEKEGASVDQLKTQYEKVYKLARGINRELVAWKSADMAAGMMLGYLKNFTTGAIGGLVKDLNDWERESTNMAATMTSSIHKAGGASKELVGQYRDLLKVSDEIIKDTHQFPGVIRKEWVKAIKKGTRSLDETKGTLTSAMSAAWQIGANAETVNEEFQKWNMQVGMSVEGSKSLARTMASVSKLTGVMGDNLTQAVAAAREIAQQMKDTGNYSQDTANSVVSWMASAQKFGLDKQVQNIFKASQGGLEAYNEASSQTKNLLAASGQLQNVMAGDADPDAVMRGIGSAIRDAIPEDAFPKGGRMAGLPDLKKLSKSEISRLDLIMKRRFGMKLGESVRLLEGIRDQNPDEKLADINRQLSDANSVLTQTEIDSLKLQKEQLEIAKKEKELAKNLNSLSTVSEALKTLPADEAERGKTLQKILEQNKINEQVVGESARLLDEKFKRQGKTFDVMGQDMTQFTAKMNSLLPKMEQGNIEAVREFRTMQTALDEANKKADSDAKNNSNNMDKMESDQQRLQNAIQNAAKPLHTMAFQAPMWTWYLAMISGGVWTLYRAWSKGRLAENMALTAQTLVQTIGTKGSGWVHDPYVEHFVKNIDKNLVGLGKHMTKGKFGGKKVDALHDSTGTKLGEFNNALDTATGKLTGWWQSLTGMLPDSLKEKLGGVKDAASNKLAQAKEKLGWKQVATDEKLLSKGVSPSSGMPADKLGKVVKGKGIDVKKPKMDASIKGNASMLDGAGKLAAIAAGVVALGVVLVGAAKVIMDMTGFDAKQAKEVAWVLGTVIGAAAGALLAAAGAAQVMKWANKTLSWGDIGNIYKGGALLLAILPAVLILGGILVGLGALLSMIMEPKKAQECAWAVGQIMLAAGIVAGAVLLSAASMTVLGLMVPVAYYILPFMLAGAVSLLILTPAMLGLAAAVLYISEKVMQKIVDPKWAKQVSGNVADIMKSAAIIAGSVLLAAVSLSTLGVLSTVSLIMLGLMLIGTRTLLLLTPAMIALAAAVIYVSEKVIKYIPDPAASAKTAGAVADIMKSAGKIALAVMTATMALTYLGSLSAMAAVILPLMVMGAGVLLLLTPAMIKMAQAVIYLADSFGSAEQAEDGKRVAQNTADILKAAGDIAMAVLKSSAYLTALGSMVLIAPYVAAMMLLGAASLMVMTPAVLKVAMAIIGMSESLAKTTDVESGKEAAANMAEILESIYKISTSLSKARNYLASFGAMSVFGGVMDVMMSRGADAISGMGGSVKKVLDAAMNFPDVDEVVSAVGELTALVNVMGGLMGVMRELSYILDEIGSMSIDFGELEKVGGVFKSGKLELVINAREPGGVDYVEKLLGVFTGVRSPAMSGNGGLLRGMRKEFGGAIQEPLSGVQKSTDRMGDLPVKVDQLKDVLHADLTTMISLMRNEGVAVVAEKTESVGGVVNNDELDRRIQARVENSRPSEAMTMSMEYLAAIEVNTAATNESVLEAVGVLSEIKEMMASSQSASSAPQVGQGTKPRGTPNYYDWKFGRFGDTAAKQYNNPGRR